MSLINDALKRASNAKPADQNAPAPAPAAPLIPVEEQKTHNARPLLGIWIGLVAVMALGTFFWWKGKPSVVVEASAKAVAKTTTSEQQAAPDAAKEAEPKPLNNPVARTQRLMASLEQKNNEAMETAETMQAKSVDGTPVPAATTPPRNEPPKVVPVVARAAAPAPIKVEQPPVPEYRLQAIYFRLKGPTAVINGKTLKIGDAIEGATVRSIERNQVSIERNGELKELALD